jgi:hypothetical protein
MRVQLASEPGYMVNYGLGAMLTAEMRQRTAEVAGSFDSGNAGWYAWVGERLLRYGSERDARSLMQDLLGRPVSPAALLAQISRCRDALPATRSLQAPATRQLSRIVSTAGTATGSARSVPVDGGIIIGE